MIHNSLKYDIIRLVKDMENAIGDEALSGLFDSSDNASGERKVGCNQFREIASDCRVAECYEEIILLIQYTRAKSKNNMSWKTNCINNKMFGEIVEEYMGRVKALCNENTSWDTLKELIQLFFGYLYWQSRIWADKYGNNAAGHNNGRPYGGRRNAVH